VQITLAK